IVAALVGRLTGGTLDFGATLSINSLAEEFNASRQPVSVAINHLRSLGYVVVVPQVGCRVISPSPAEIADFFYVLAHMESALASLAAKRHDAREGEILRAIAAEIAAAPFDSPEHRRYYASAVDTFHASIWGMSRATAVIARVRDLWQLADFYLWHGAGNFDAGGVATANREREAIVRAITRGDAPKAESLMAKHVRGKPARVGII
ncbi:MAG: GntR family transcriptional regulator, partial [Gammaproteobacteria bacterium]